MIDKEKISFWLMEIQRHYLSEEINAETEKEADICARYSIITECFLERVLSGDFDVKGSKDA